MAFQQQNEFDSIKNTAVRITLVSQCHHSIRSLKLNPLPPDNELHLSLQFAPIMPQIRTTCQCRSHSGLILLARNKLHFYFGVRRKWTIFETKYWAPAYSWKNLVQDKSRKFHTFLGTVRFNWFFGCISPTVKPVWNVYEVWVFQKKALSPCSFHLQPVKKHITPSTLWASHDCKPNFRIVCSHRTNIQLLPSYHAPSISDAKCISVSNISDKEHPNFHSTANSDSTTESNIYKFYETKCPNVKAIWYMFTHHVWISYIVSNCWFKTISLFPLILIMAAKP